jgi:hypothetical protein
MVEKAHPPLIAAPMPNTKPPSTAAPVSGHPRRFAPTDGISKMAGMVTAVTHSIDFPMLASM